jgi:RNA polymerase sigma-70 factor (ECF subfamily)
VTDWNMIVEQYGQLVWAMAYRMLGNPADAADCFQDTFLEAIKVARREPVRQWEALLRHLVMARSLDLLRARCRRRARTDAAADPDAAPSREAAPGQAAEASELVDRLRAALAHLPDEQVEVFCLSCLDKLSYREIGERLRLTTNSVGVLLHRARQRLRELLAPVDAGSRTED